MKNAGKLTLCSGCSSGSAPSLPMVYAPTLIATIPSGTTGAGGFSGTTGGSGVTVTTGGGTGGAGLARPNRSHPTYPAAPNRISTTTTDAMTTPVRFFGSGCEAPSETGQV